MLVPLGLFVAFVLLILFTNRRTRLCRWREYPGEDESRWACAYCGAETTGPRGDPPRACLRRNG